MIKLTSLCAISFLALGSFLNAADPAPAKSASPEFEKMKSLVGKWAGKTDVGQGPVDMIVEYRLLAAGSVLEERVMSGTPNEMVTMFYDKGGKLALTHYCMLGNRPEMALKSSDANSISFDFDSCCGIDPKKEAHMHAMTIRFDDAETITSTCKAIMNGQETPDHAMTLKRVSGSSTAAK